MTYSYFRRTGATALETGIYICMGGCGTLIKTDAGEAMPWCVYCMARVEWRYLSASGTFPKVSESSSSDADKEIG